MLHFYDAFIFSNHDPQTRVLCSAVRTCVGLMCRFIKWSFNNVLGLSLYWRSCTAQPRLKKCGQVDVAIAQCLKLNIILASFCNALTHYDIPRNSGCREIFIQSKIAIRSQWQSANMGNQISKTLQTNLFPLTIFSHLTRTTHFETHLAVIPLTSSIDQIWCQPGFKAPTRWPLHQRCCPLASGPFTSLPFAVGARRQLRPPRGHLLPAAGQAAQPAGRGRGPGRGARGAEAAALQHSRAGDAEDRQGEHERRLPSPPAALDDGADGQQREAERRAGRGGGQDGCVEVSRYLSVFFRILTLEKGFR